MDDRKALKEYVDACELARETEEDIRRLKQRQKSAARESVKGSSPEYPYNERHFKVEGLAYPGADGARIREEERLLMERREKAERIRLQALGAMNLAPPRIQRIIRFRYFEGLPWGEVAARMGRQATEDGIRKEVDRYFRGKN